MKDCAEAIVRGEADAEEILNAIYAFLCVFACAFLFWFRLVET